MFSPVNPRTAGPRRGPIGLPLALALVLATGVVAACGSGDGAGPDGDEGTVGFIGPVWVLDGAASEPAIDAGATVTLAADSGRASGQAPCNTYNADLTVDGDSIEVGPIATTKMACEPATGEAETVFLQALGSVDTLVVDGDGVTLTGPDVALVFDAQDLASAIVGTWEVINLAVDDALSSPLKDTTPTINFAEDGSLAANGGCNQIGATWQLDGSALSIGEGQRTLMACMDPEGVMEQEDALAAALERAARVEITDQLTILDAEDAILVVADRAPEG